MLVIEVEEETKNRQELRHLKDMTEKLEQQENQEASMIHVQDKPENGHA